MFFRLLGDSLLRRKSRKLLAVVAVWIGLSLVLAFLGLSIDVRDKMNRELQSLGANIKLEPVTDAIAVRLGGYELASSRPDDYLREDDLPKLKNIFWRNNILGIAPRLWIHARLGETEVPVLGTWFQQRIPVDGGEPFVTGAQKMYEHWQIEGRWPRPEQRNPVDVLVGTDLAERLGIKPEDRIELGAGEESVSAVVAGLVNSGRREDRAVVAPLETVQQMSGLSGRIASADVKALTTPPNKLAEKHEKKPESLTPEEYERWVCTPYPGSVAADIQGAVPGATARVVRRVSETQGTVLRRIEGLMYLLAGLTLVVCCLSVMGVITSAVLERRPEVALMQAVGAHRSDILWLLMSEATVLGLLGGLLASGTGSLLGDWLIQAVFGTEAGVHGALILLAPFLGLIVAWLGSLWPVWQALNTNTIEVLHGN